jgi:3-hydroxybenzoate 6-monooxygenase
LQTVDPQPPTKSSPLRVLISGGGIGGLAAALALARTGADVRVFEKRANPNEEGAGIQIGPNGTRILQSLGLADHLRSKVTAPKALYVHDGPMGVRVAELPLGDWLAERHGAPYWVAHRADLHAALSSAVDAHPLIELRHGIEIENTETYADEVLARSGGQIVGAGDVLIAADGLRSTLRQSLFGARQPRYSGKSAARTVIGMEQAPEGIAKDSVGIWLAPKGHVVHYPVRGGRELAIVVIRNDLAIDEGWATAVNQEWVKDAVQDFVAPVQNLIAASDSWRKWALFELPPLKTWTADRVVLLGDAAHPVLPFLAQGAVLALEDALTLARCLSDSETVRKALHSYQTQRSQRAQSVQAASRRNGQIYHLDGPMRQARNMTLTMSPPKRIMASYDWLYGWRPRV